jgi:hypothetical protein
MTQGRTIQLRPGFVLRDLSSAKGGITYHREHGHETPINAGEGYRQEINSVKKVDHEAIVKEGQALANQSRGVIRRYATDTEAGWYVSRADMVHVREQMDDLQPLADAFNAKARAAYSDCRVRVGCIAFPLEIDNYAAAKEIARTVREVCEDLIQVLKAADFKNMTSVFGRCRHLEQLGTGMQRDSIVFAIDEAKAARKALKKAKRDGEDSKEVAMKLDLEMLESCVGMFSEMTTFDSNASDGGAQLALVV